MSQSDSVHAPASVVLVENASGGVLERKNPYEISIRVNGSRYEFEV